MSNHATPRIWLREAVDSVPVIGFGTWLYSGGHGVLRRAAELDCGLVDTAELYGNEELVGAEIAPIRDQVFLATKVSPENLGLADVINHCLASLERLQTATIDLYQVHWPNPAIPINETMRGMRHLVEQGLVRYVGVSNFSVSQMEAAQAALGDIPLVSNQVNYSLLDRGAEAEVLPWCKHRGVVLVAYRPLARFQLGEARPVLEAVAKESGHSIAQVLLNWAIGTGGVVVIPKTDQIERVDELAAAAQFELTADQRARLEKSVN